ncbi:hypothetical protein H072_2352 [Dactylellina haptotyla CBS 200.50]|uniref:Uncharacterized protein n=1 Tax=Dactylellina haptotyla (strain CBS 200.50) TaxID=1284197 RepID=S8ARN4_DACHA|nr:hypothetical protein H072_2352 [Dactylellina haptotyla CBS 200.50]
MLVTTSNAEKIVITNEEYERKIDEYTDLYIRPFQDSYAALYHISRDIYPLILGPHPDWTGAPPVSDRINSLVKAIDESMIQLAALPGFEDAPTDSPVTYLWQPLFGLRSKIKAYLLTKVVVNNGIWANPTSSTSSLDIWLFINSLITNTGFHASPNLTGSFERVIRWLFSAKSVADGAETIWTLDPEALRTRVEVIWRVIETFEDMMAAPLPYMSNIENIQDPELDFRPETHFAAQFQEVQAMMKAYLVPIKALVAEMLNIHNAYVNTFLRED